MRVASAELEDQTMPLFSPLRRAAQALALSAPLVLAIAAGPVLGEAAFLTGVEDLPLMPGLSEVAGAATVFDAPQGRIVESFASGHVSAEDVLAFYGQTLPQLGWHAAGPREYRREGEKLTLEVTPGATETTVRFTLAPQ
ncbi:MAG: hypothetical protein BroJett029_17220 [Alphaproteobacteria bacterium]|nr:MAG: hypothetical protein BroJett029_17220 [Alphaproteobacteria bacterium]